MMDESEAKSQEIDHPETESNSDHSSAVKDLLARTGYKLETFPSSRVYGGPPPDFTGDEPKEECQVFIGRLPPEMKEDEIIPVFEKIGKIYVMRLIMERLPSTNSRGYAFLCYLTPEHATSAIQELNNHEIRPGVNIAVSKSDGNKRLYMGNIHKEKTQEELLKELQILFTGVKSVFVQQDVNEPSHNRGYAFVDFVDHKTAVDIRRQCATDRKILFGRQIRNVDWADVQQAYTEPDPETVKSLHIAPVSEETTEEMIKEKFAEFGTVEKVQKIRDYAFVHLSSREEAVKAKETAEKTLNGSEIEISFAKPKLPAKKRKSRGGGRGRGHYRGRGGGGYYPNYDYYGDPMYGGGEMDGYDYGYDMYGGGYCGGGYYDNYSRGRGGGSGVWMSKRRKPNDEKRAEEKWLDPNVADQVGGNAGGNWW